MDSNYIDEFPYNIILDEELDERSMSDTLIDTIYSDNRTRYFNYRCIRRCISISNG